MAKRNRHVESSCMGISAIMGQLEALLPHARRESRRGASPGAGCRAKDPREEAAKKWLSQAAGDPWSVVEQKLMAAMRVTFASPEHEGVAAHALVWLLGRPTKDKRAGLVFFGSMQRDENCSFLPLSMVAAESGGKVAGVLAMASVEDLLALGEGICPEHPSAGAAQLAAAASANVAISQDLRDQARVALEEICSEDSGAAQFALLSLDPVDSGEEAGINFAWPAASGYKKAFAGAPLEREALLHLLARHREGDKLLAWCSEAGFDGARWPCSKAACRIGIEEPWPLEGLAETGANRLRDDEKALFWSLGRQEEELGDVEKEALAREFGKRPSLAIAAMNKAPWITRQVYDKPERAASSWVALDERARRLGSVWVAKSLEDIATPMILDLGRVVGLRDLPPAMAWAKEAVQRHLQGLEMSPAPGSEKSVAELEGMLLALEAHQGSRARRPKTL